MLWLKRILLGFLALVLVVIVALFVVLHTEAFWRLVGKDVLKFAQQECRCSLTVGEIRGNPFDGLIFKNIAIATAEEEVIRAKSLEMRLSLWSLLRLEILVDKVVVQEPKVNIRQESDGEWNIVKIIPPPPKQLRHFFAVKFSDILIADGSGVVVTSGQTQHFSNLNAEMNLEVYNPHDRQTDRETGIRPGHRHHGDRQRQPGQPLHLRRKLLSTSGFSRSKAATGPCCPWRARRICAKRGRFRRWAQINLSPEEIHRVWDRWPQTWGTRANFRMHGTRSQFHVAVTGEVQKITFDVEGDLGTEVGNYSYDI